jgi:hypothetical protein
VPFVDSCLSLLYIVLLSIGSGAEEEGAWERAGGWAECGGRGGRRQSGADRSDGPEQLGAILVIG